MLAMNYRTADELGITEEQRAALIKTLGFFERGEVPAEQFNMSQRYTHCGSAVCIFGWVDKLAPGCFPRSISVNAPAVTRLFSPSGPAINCRDPELGAQALRNYLTRPGDPWEGVLP